MILYLYLNMYSYIYVHIYIYEWTWWVAWLKANMKIEERYIVWNNDTDHCGMRKRKEGHIFCTMMIYTTVYMNTKNQHYNTRLSGSISIWNSSFIEASMPSLAVSFFPFSFYYKIDLLEQSVVFIFWTTLQKN